MRHVETDLIQNLESKWKGSRDSKLWKQSFWRCISPGKLLYLIKQIRIIIPILNCKLCNWIKLEGAVLHPLRGSAAAVAVMQWFLQPGELFPQKLWSYMLVSASGHNCKILQIDMKMFSLLPALQSVKQMLKYASSAAQSYLTSCFCFLVLA